mmetsp:Transcript_24089/g.47835  ORF Transcript_24089/g.47835 Transcript_24089/m.47835 type:complete len:233 (+) Transcript_24089:1440-2138(+)
MTAAAGIPRARIRTYVSAAENTSASMLLLPIIERRSGAANPNSMPPSATPTNPESCRAEQKNLEVPRVLSWSPSAPNPEATKLVVAVYIKAMSRAVYSVTATAGFSAACCAVPAHRPTAQVSMSERRGLHSHTPTAGRANFKILRTSGASTAPAPFLVAVSSASCFPTGERVKSVAAVVSSERVDSPTDISAETSPSRSNSSSSSIGSDRSVPSVFPFDFKLSLVPDIVIKW